MTIAFALLVYGALVGVIADQTLPRVTPHRGSARSAMTLWHAAAIAVITSTGSALFLLAHDAWEHTLAWVLHADKALLHAQYAGPQEVPGLWNAVLSVQLLLTGVLVFKFVSKIARARRDGRLHRLAVFHETRISDRHGGNRVGLVRHRVPAIYCVPAEKRKVRILVTDAAVEALTPSQLEAAIAHEAAHVSGRHHAMIAFADTVGSMASRVGLLRHYGSAVRTLVEHAADEEAARRCGAVTVAGALLELCVATPQRPSAALHMTGTDPATRIQSLLLSSSERRPFAFSQAIGVAILVALAPIATALTPAITVSGTIDQTPAQQGKPAQPDEFVHHN